MQEIRIPRRSLMEVLDEGEKVLEDSDRGHKVKIIAETNGETNDEDDQWFYEPAEGGDMP